MDSRTDKPNEPQAPTQLSRATQQFATATDVRASADRYWELLALDDDNALAAFDVGTAADDVDPTPYYELFDVQTHDTIGIVRFRHGVDADFAVRWDSNTARWQTDESMLVRARDGSVGVRQIQAAAVRTMLSHLFDLSPKRTST